MPPAEASKDLERWIVLRVARRAGLDADRVAPDRPFAHWGLDSVAVVELAAELADHLGRALPETLAFDHPSPRELAAALSTGRAPAPARRSAAPTRAALPVAVVGLAVRLPGADDLDGLWDLLVAGDDAIGAAPAGRWDGGDDLPPGGFLAGDPAEFDAAFFGIAPREAEAMDPQQRLLTEVCWEALEDAGIAPSSLAGMPAGVWTGVSSNDFARLLADRGPTAHAATGTPASIAAGRLSYLLDLHGPSMAVDTACSSSLVALHLACQSLAAGETELAIVGGVNLMLSAAPTRSLLELGALSPGGRCRPFSAEADGYARGEGAVVAILKPLERALADDDRVWAIIRGTAVNGDGRTNGLTAPSGRAQQQVVRAALQRAGVRPADVGCVEAHGTGTALGDPIEAEALARVLGDGRELDDLCALGSVKGNVGHLEAAAGLAGLAKLVLQLHHRTLVPSLHAEPANPRIPFERGPLRVTTALEPWPADRPVIGGVSSFGFSGTNAHAVLEAPATAVPA